MMKHACGRGLGGVLFGGGEKDKIGGMSWECRFLAFSVSLWSFSIWWFAIGGAKGSGGRCGKTRQDLCWLVGRARKREGENKSKI